MSENNNLIKGILGFAGLGLLAVVGFWLNAENDIQGRSVSDTTCEKLAEDITKVDFGEGSNIYKIGGKEVSWYYNKNDGKAVSSSSLSSAWAMETLRKLDGQETQLITATGEVLEINRSNDILVCLGRIVLENGEKFIGFYKLEQDLDGDNYYSYEEIVFD